MSSNRKTVIAGNWKMNSGIEEGVNLCKEIISNLPTTDAEIIVCPPHTHLYAVSTVLKNSSVSLGAQNVHKQEKGAFTGDVSAKMVAETGAEWVIVGHSERRQYYGETGADIREKILMAQESGMGAIFCVGERIHEREAGVYLEVITRQINEVLDKRIDFSKLIIAYEPVWSIGTGKTASPSQANEVHMHIRQCVAFLASTKISEEVRILYGGSMKPDNAESLLTEEHVDGGLIGGASLNATSFCGIISHA